ARRHTDRLCVLLLDHAQGIRVSRCLLEAERIHRLHRRRNWRVRPRLSHIALVFPFELADDLELGKSTRPKLAMVLESEFWKHDRRPVDSQFCGRVVGSQDPSADLTSQPSHLTLVNISQRVKVFVEKCVEDIGVEGLSILRYMRDLVE